MKEFDIEKWERQNIFKKDDLSFEQMREGVLKGIKLAEPSGKIIKMNWIYTAAAAVALIFGLTFFLSIPANAETDLISNQIVNTPEPILTEKNDRLPVDVEPINTEKKVQDLTFVKSDHPKTVQPKNADFAKSTKKVAVDRKKKEIMKPALEVEQILATFTKAEMADLAKNAEQDIYLDLYN